MKNSLFFAVILFSCHLQLLSQQPSVSIKLNEEERFRFEDARLIFINSSNSVYIGDSTAIDAYGSRNVVLGNKAGKNLKGGVNNTFLGFQAGYADTSGFSNVFIGVLTGWKNTSGSRNTFVGTNAGFDNTTGLRNTFIGLSAGGGNTTGSYNTYVGRIAGRYNQEGERNVFIGDAAGGNEMGSDRLYIANSDTTSPLIYGEFDTQLLRFNAKRIEIRGSLENTIIGDSSGVWTTGDKNTFVGYRAGYSNTNGNGNTFIGRVAGHSNLDGSGNVFIGNFSGHANTSGGNNVILGISAGRVNTEGSLNVIIGTTSGFYNTTGRENVFLGTSAGAANQTGSYNTYLGRGTGWNNTEGSGNVFVGYRAGTNETNSNKLYISNSDTIAPLIYGEFDNELLRVHGTLDIKGIYQFPIVDGVGGQVLKTDGSGSLSWSGDVGATDINGLSDGKTGGYSVFLGSGAGGNDDGTNRWNVAVGHTSLLDNVDGMFNTAVGAQSLMNCEGSYNTATGYQALFNNTNAGYNTAHGAWALYSNETGGYNNAFGYGALYSNLNGYYNTAFGHQSLYMNTSGERNTAVGVSALLNNTTGNYNTAVGNGALTANLAGHGNIAIGHLADYHNQNGSYNTILGYEAGKSTAVHNKSGNVFIGYQAGYYETGNNKLYIENSDTIAPLIYGDFENDTLRVNGTLDINNAFHFPLTDGTSGQVLQSNGSGTLSWAAVGGDFSNGGEAGGANRSLGNTDNYDLSMKTNNTNRIKIKNDGGIRLDGKVGIFTDPASPGINNSIKLYDAVTFSNPYLEISGHNRAYIYLQSRRTGNTSETSGKTWSIASGSGSIADLDMFYIYNPDDGYCFTIRDGGNIGVNTTEPTAKMDINGSTGYDQLRIRTSFTPTSSGDTNGNTGDIAWDDDYIYIKTSTGWKRSALTSW